MDSNIGFFKPLHTVPARGVQYDVLCPLAKVRKLYARERALYMLHPLQEMSCTVCVCLFFLRIILLFCARVKLSGVICCI